MDSGFWFGVLMLVLGLAIGYYGGHEQGWKDGQFALWKERQEAERLR
jgi:hypothetical protein